MQPVFSLAYLTAAPLPPPETIDLAARLGYGAVGLRALPAAPGGAFSPLIEDKTLLKATQARIAATGVTVYDMEIVRLNERYRTEDYLPFLEICGALSAKAILVGGDDPDRNRLVENYAAFCTAARPYGLTCDLEFMPWTPVASARDALDVVTKADQPNGGILVDSLHAARSATSLADIADLPRHLLHYAQICDAEGAIPTTNEGLIFTARQARLLPGEGGIDITGIFGALPQDLPVSVEIPHDVRKAAVGVEEWARQALATSRAAIAKAWV